MNVMLSQFYADIHLQTIAWLNYEQCQQCSQISGLGENCSYRNEHGHRSNVNLSEIIINLSEHFSKHLHQDPLVLVSTVIF